MILEGLTDIETGGWLELSLKDGRISMGGGGDLQVVYQVCTPTPKLFLHEQLTVDASTRLIVSKFVSWKILQPTKLLGRGMHGYSYLISEQMVWCLPFLCSIIVKGRSR